ncbi:phosphate/phosphite/phosphonate ABC transporter substrate-binding protein [Halomonas alkalisoli]|uniref:phosphate/phosphite/phosphonate ABC transporter substrate-binding protein n=1 Tax=Halomonas alkalisoli TaxID=2907158 RepID=UPI001F2ED435|nr:phosphate/phosphite/phosphonate ABC transporter substrate-binding protein [Halomonas alkalisoli]MCE9682893.1 phosphate/phosphite/phosphonate ABC transporter substrate-binding protein [Halomonas alkalisoli]
MVVQIAKCSWFKLLLGVLMVALAADLRGEVPDRLVMSFTPEAAPLELELDARGLAAFLERELGMPVVAQVDADYTGTVEAMRAGHAHIAFLSPLAAALAHEVAGARMILAEERRGQPYYHSRYWVRRDSGIDDLGDLRGKTVAFNDPLSASGYLFPVAKLIEEGLIETADEIHSFFGRLYFAGGTELSLRALMNGFVDAAGVSRYGPEVFLSPAEREELIYFGEHGPIPNHGIAVSGTLPDTLVEALVAAFLRLNEPEHNAILRRVYGWQRLTPVDTALYLPLLELSRRIGGEGQTP